MCGIVGIFRSGSVTEAETRKLCEYVSHRGPDGIGVWARPQEGIGLGHARLAILDLSSAADQPMVSRDGRYVIVFNGEVYNFVEIARDLVAKGVTLRTASDTEVVLEALALWGVEALNRFNGMWALALYDTRERTLMLCRDRFGVKPLYVHFAGNDLLFASEIKAIARFLPSQEFDPAFINGLLRQDTTLFGSDETYIKGVKSVAPGHFMTITCDGDRSTQAWYRLGQVNVPSGFSQQVDRFRELFENACRIRLRSDVPVATCLSGGIDSGSIVSLLSTLRPEAEDRTAHFVHKSFTAAFPGTSLDETAAARMLADEKQMDLDVKVIETPTADEMEDALAACDGPMPALAFYPIWKLYRHVRASGITVTLDGQGADEMLGGYWIGEPALLSGLKSLKPSRVRDLYRTYSMLHTDAPNWTADAYQSAQAQFRSEWDARVKYPLKVVLHRLGLNHRDPSATLVKNPAQPAFLRTVSPEDPNCREPLGAALLKQFFANPLPFLLHQYDRCSMANGVECRMPFMDYRLVEYVFSLPLTSRIGGGYTKRVLREAVKGLLPEPIRTNRLKTGFNAPFSAWLGGPLREWLSDILSSRAFVQSSYFDGKPIAESMSTLLKTAPGRIDERSLWPYVHLTWLASHSN